MPGGTPAGEVLTVIMKIATLMLTITLVSSTIQASGGRALDPGEHSKGAAKVVLATITAVDSAFGENAYGDQLIMSDVTVRVEETMKGVHEGSLVMAIEGGTVGELTLAVSDMPTMEKGQRAVLFLSTAPGGGYVPSGRGAGVVEIDANDRAVGSDLTLNDIRAAVKAAQARGNQ